MPSRHRLLHHSRWKMPGETAYALEGSSFIAGAAVQWLRDGLGIIKSASEIEALARSVSDSGECVFVPALTGWALRTGLPTREGSSTESVATPHARTWPGPRSRESRSRSRIWWTRWARTQALPWRP